MAWLTKTAVAALLSLAVVGCASNERSSRPAASGMPCERCRFGVADPQGGTTKNGCMVDGKRTDCRKSPPQCAECAKITQAAR